MADGRPVVLITGASGGVGRAVAAEMARHGYSAALLYRTGKDAAESAAQAVHDAGGEALVLQADLADPEAVRLAASLAERMESHSGDVCGEAIGPEVASLPPSS